MKLPRRRSSRPRGAARLALAGDFPGDHDITQAMQAIPPAPWDGTTIPLSALRGQPHYTPDQPRPPILLAGQQAPWVMAVSPPRPGGPGPTAQALEVVRFLHAKVTILKRKGQAGRIDPDKVARVPVDRARNRRTSAMLIVDEAAELLRCGGDMR
jgi:hypothetical protein